MDTKQEYEQELSRKLADWQHQIDEIEAKVSQVDTQNLLEFERQLDLLNAKHHLAGERLQKMRVASSAEWDELKASVDGIRNEIENALDSAAAKIERFL